MVRMHIYLESPLLPGAMLSEYNLPDQKEHRQQLRNSSTKPEKVLWESIRFAKLGVKFRRQFGIGCYILDFYCPGKRGAIEVDGAYHQIGHQPRYDADRDAFLQARGIKVLRFTNEQVLKELETCLAQIHVAIID